MTRQFEDWRKELEMVDAELARLLNRRVRLAIELLSTLRKDLTLGDLTHDADRLSILLFENPEQFNSDLDQEVVQEFFRIVSKECRRLAEEEIKLAEHNGNAQ